MGDRVTCPRSQHEPCQRRFQSHAGSDSTTSATWRNRDANTVQTHKAWLGGRSAFWAGQSLLCSHPTGTVTSFTSFTSLPNTTSTAAGHKPHEEILLDGMDFLSSSSARNGSLPDFWQNRSPPRSVQQQGRHFIVPVSPCHREPGLTDWHVLVAVSAARWAAPCSPDGYLFHQPPLLHPRFTPAQDSLQHSCCKAAPANNFAKWLLSKSWASQTDWLLHLQQLLAKRRFPFWLHLLAAPETSCQKGDLTHQLLQPSLESGGPMKASVCVPHAHLWARCHNRLKKKTSEGKMAQSIKHRPRASWKLGARKI